MFYHWILIVCEYWAIVEWFIGSRTLFPELYVVENVAAFELRPSYAGYRISLKEVTERKEEYTM